MKNGASKYDAQYEKMGGKPDIKRAIGLFNVMSEYMDFYERWIRTCTALNRSIDNPNRILARRWSERASYRCQSFSVGKGTATRGKGYARIFETEYTFRDKV